MKVKTIISVVAALGFASAALAGEEIKKKMAIAVVEGEGDQAMHFKIDSDDLGFDLGEMQLGENRAIVDESGRTILITREEDGYSFDIDGKTIRLPAFDENEHDAVWISDGGEKNVEVIVLDGEGHDASHDGEHKVRVIKKEVETISN